MALTAKRIATLNAKGRYLDRNNLYLQVNGPTAKSWIFRWERDGRERQMGLGPLDMVTLEEARDLAHNARRQLHRGIDPLKERKAERAALTLEAAKSITFKDAARDYLRQHEGKWTNMKSAKEFLATMERYVFPKIANLAVSDIDNATVLRVLEPVWHTRTETADRVRNRIEAILDWAKVRGYRVGDNPARWAGNLQHVLPGRFDLAPAKNLASMPFSAVPAFIQKLRRSELIAARALELAILCASRTNEINGAMWDEIDLQAKVWTIPGVRMKAGKLHRVPLCDHAVALLEALPRENGNPHVFIGTTAHARIGINSIRNLLRQLEGKKVFTVHGFRSSFRTWVAEATSFPSELAEMSLAHSVGNAVEQAYRRGDVLEKRRKLMQAWAAYCTASPRANVVPMKVAV